MQKSADFFMWPWWQRTRDHLLQDQPASQRVFLLAECYLIGAEWATHLQPSLQSAEPFHSKIRAFMKQPLLQVLTRCAAALIVLGVAWPALAEKADRDKPMNIEANSLRYDDLKQTTVLTGNVVITKGTIVIRGDRVDVVQDPQGYQQATSVGTPNKLAYYRSKREGVDEFIEGEGERVEYDSRADVVKFIRQGVVRRYSGSKLLDETTGALITYDNTTDVFTVDGGPQNRTAANPSGRVRAMLAPRSAASAPAPAAPAPGTAPVLRPSTSIKP
jgi:lipopolysaccharide export system protein LptA